MGFSNSRRILTLLVKKSRNRFFPRDSTSGLGVKMVEYVLGGSPTNKDSPLSGLEPRLRSLKFDDSDKSHDDKEKGNSPFDSNGLKKDDQVTGTNGVVNGIDDDKGFKMSLRRTEGLGPNP
uniref:Uncharacterized protein n=2 Tax=Glossina TaxID=7393 RepID=A0A1A9VN94_GLOAU